MFKRFAIAGSVAVLSAGVAVGAQTPAQERPTEPQQAQSEPGQVTFVGCVYQEKDVPGRTPNAAERAGIMEDYILVNASPKGEKTSEATPGATGTSGMTTAKPKMFKLENPDDERLRALVGKRVEVTGKVDPERSDAPAGTNPQPDESIGPDRINLPELEVISITETEGTCPSKPEIGK